MRIQTSVTCSEILIKVVTVRVLGILFCSLDYIPRVEYKLKSGRKLDLSNHAIKEMRQRVNIHGVDAKLRLIVAS